MENHFAFISVGANVGNKLLNCRKGIAALTSSGKSVLRGQSGFYKTEPVDYKDQDWFVNAVVKIETAHDPFELLSELKAIERDAGRAQDAIRFGPRILDLDIVFYDGLIINSPKLILPHPRMHKRHFVLKPICDIEYKFMHPVLKKDMQSLLDGLDKNGQRLIQFK